jgi:ring-1,2-phenylacetyl-CoA epoxidase subunit PaaE
LPDDLREDAVVLFFAAGSGITPVMSLLRHFLTHYPKGQAVLFYSNKTSESIIFRDSIEALKNQHMTRFSVYHILTKELTSVDIFSGRVDAAKCVAFGRHFFDIREVDGAFICGPELMIHDVKDALVQMGLAADRIRFELFGSGAFKSSRKEERDDVRVGEDKMSKVTIRIDGHEADFQIGYQGQAVLDVAMQGGLDIPYSCKGGVCSTCRALVVEGKVHMDIQYGLEPDEVDAGYVLTCQAHPRSERLILDYDIL